jgi:acetyl-CoA C-acetyltransferase
MADAFIYDAVRTPRGKGKADGGLHEVTAIELGAQALRAIASRNALKSGVVEDVIMGCVDPVGEAGGDIARTCALKAGLGTASPGIQINRFCASGLDAVNFAAAQVMAGQKDLAVGGGVESMSRVGMGASGYGIAFDPSVAIDSYFMPQGVAADLIATKYGFSRDDVDAYAVESHKRAARAWEKGHFKKSVIPVKDVNGLTILARDETIRPNTDMQALGALKASFGMMADQGGFGAVAIQSHPEIVRHRGRRGGRAGRLEGGRQAARPQAPRAHPRLRHHRL